MIKSVDIRVLQANDKGDEIFGPPGIFKYGKVAFVYQGKPDCVGSYVMGRIQFLNFKQQRFVPEDSNPLFLNVWLSPDVKFQYYVNETDDTQAGLQIAGEAVLNLITHVGLTLLLKKPV